MKIPDGRVDLVAQGVGLFDCSVVDDETTAGTFDSRGLVTSETLIDVAFTSCGCDVITKPSTTPPTNSPTGDLTPVPCGRSGQSTYQQSCPNHHIRKRHRPRWRSYCRSTIHGKMGWNLISLVCRQYLPRNHFGYLNKLSIELVIFAKWVDSPVLFLPRNTTFATNAVCYCPPYGGKRPKAPIVAERVVILCDRIHFANLYGKLHFVSSREPGFLRFLA